MQFIMKKINDKACHYNEHSNNNDPFTCIAVHGTKIALISGLQLQK